MSTPKDASTADETRLAARLEHWLVSDEAVLSEPPHVAGGVINYREADGAWDGVYPEICGYYLQFLVQASVPPAVVETPEWSLCGEGCG